jgi:BACON domain-containing protein
MDTKRCLSCHKQLRADAHSCSRCGYVFSQAPVRRSGSATNGSRRSDAASFPSNPPASQHRAGHYSGLHPEDQPFQSSFMPVQRPPAITRRLVEQEPDELLLPAVAASPATPQLAPPLPEQPVPEQLSKRRVASPSPLPMPMPQRHLGAQSQMPASVPQLEFAAPPLPPELELHQQLTAPVSEQMYLPGKRQLRSHIVPILLLASCVMFLLATSILAFLLLDRRPADKFHASVTTTITGQQALHAPPKLQLPVSQIDFGADVPGVVSHKTIKLTNAGGEQIDWRAGSDSSWLTISPGNGTFSMSANATLTVKRGNLTPQAYTGYITFYQQGNNNIPLTLKVAMVVSPFAANLSLAPASLTFNGNTTQNPSSQAVTVQNTGGQALDWIAITGTATGGNWLSVSNVSGHLEANSQQTITVSAISTGLAIGTYHGSLTFSYAGGTPATQVLITLIVSPPPVPVMVIKSNALSFSAIQGTNPAPQTFTIANTGNAPLNWAIAEDANATAFAPVSSTRGTVAPGKSAAITVKPNVVNATAGVINGHITISDTDKGTPVQSQQVTVTITISNQAVITVSDTTLPFNQTSTITNSTRLLVITNSGSASLNWALSQSLPSWLSIDIPGGTLSPGTSTFVDVTCNSSALPVGNYSYTLVVSDTDTGTPVAPQNVQVTLAVTT